MRIFSKFHDYYDTAIGYGVDKTITYSRKTTHHEWDSDIGGIVKSRLGDWSLSTWPHFEPTPFNNWGESKNISIGNTVVVIFCGKQYVGIELKKSGAITGLDVSEICYNTDQVDRFFKNNKSVLPKKAKKNKKYWREGLTAKGFDLFWEKWNKDQDKNLIYLHFEVDAPVITVSHDKNLSGGGEISVNPCLKDIQFYRCVDGFTAFQELSMFIGGIMGGKSPKMVEISDKDRIAMRGFDKWSFRKMPEGA